MKLMSSIFCNTNHRLVLQFHITGRCNLRCKHCYRTEGDVEPLSLDDIKCVIDQFIVLRERYNTEHKLMKRGHINLTGGEPFFRSDIKEVIRYIDRHKSKLTYGILTNGSFINDEIIEVLKETNVSFVQFSIDGSQKIHDSLRKDGDYMRVFETAQKIELEGIRSYISFTANKENYKTIPIVAKECRKRKISKLWSDRLVPIGNGHEMQQLKITEKELLDYIRVLKKAQGSWIMKRMYPKTQVTMNRALQFIGSTGSIYTCSAGESLITVDEFGHIMPCRRMPIICGDVFTSTLEKIYYEHENFCKLRTKQIPGECMNCEYSCICCGGAKCQSFAEKGDYKLADPACPLKKR